VIRPQLEEVFKLSGIPTYTFVKPQEYERLLVALRTPGRGVVIEGPSGIGKTTAVTKALDEIPNGSGALKLSGRRRQDRELIAELPSIDRAGVVIIDDFHRLDETVRAGIADHLKFLADEEDSETKIVIVGINKAGESLINFAKDLSGRLDVIRFEANPVERLAQLVREGSQIMNIRLPEGEIARSAYGSFHLTQLICHTACLSAAITAAQNTLQTITTPVSIVIEKVIDDLSMTFSESAMKFAMGPRLSREGRAPYLHILKWLSTTPEWTLNLDREVAKYPELRNSVTQVVERGHLADFLQKNVDLGDLLHFDPRTHILAVEDPKFFFFIKHLTWGKFSELVGYLHTGFTSRYDFALSFSGSERTLAKKLFDLLSDLEFSVFYDQNEQSRIMAADIEQYLAPIYQSEATYVICLLSQDYPQRIWTRFEGRQFRSRFGVESVIPIWIDDAPTVFDQTGNVGGYFIKTENPMAPQLEYLGELLQKKIADYRLLPPIPQGQFYCRQCRLVQPIAVLAEGRVGLCADCGEKWKIL
jgi:hypothetical protein